MQRLIKTCVLPVVISMGCLLHQEIACTHSVKETKDSSKNVSVYSLVKNVYEAHKINKTNDFEYESFQLFPSFGNEKDLFEVLALLAEIRIDARKSWDEPKQERLTQSIAIPGDQRQGDRLPLEKQGSAKTYILIIVLLSILTVLSVLWNLKSNLRNKKVLARQKKEIHEKDGALAQKNDVISAHRNMVFEQKDRIEHIHTEITKSIEYSKKIQTAILPKHEDLSALTRDCFIFFHPRDIVSGDFYWCAKIEDAIVITVADCTGHGVPGAIMSMLGMSLLKEIVVKEYITQPAVILRKLRKEIIRALGQKGESGEQKDGMDMSLITIHYENNLLEYAGAFNPIYLIRNKSNPALPGQIEAALEDNDFWLYVIEADKMPVAYYDRMDKFTNCELEFKEGDQLYLFTDGLADQFGGPKNKKFMYRQFMNILLQNASENMEKQGAMLTFAYDEWKGDHFQVDDVCVLGIKL